MIKLHLQLSMWYAWVCCSVGGQWPEGARGWLSDCSSSTDLSSLCSATASLLLLCWPRRSDACTLQVNKECHWQRERKKERAMEREVKSGGGNKGDTRKEGGKEAQEGDRRESWGRRTIRCTVERGIRGRRWRWQTKRYNPAGSEGWHHSRTGLVTGGEVFFFLPSFAEGRSKKERKRLQGQQETERKKASGTSVYICVNYVSWEKRESECMNVSVKEKEWRCWTRDRSLLTDPVLWNIKRVGEKEGLTQGCEGQSVHTYTRHETYMMGNS